MNLFRPWKESLSNIKVELSSSLGDGWVKVIFNLILDKESKYYDIYCTPELLEKTVHRAAKLPLCKLCIARGWAPCFCPEGSYNISICLATWSWACGLQTSRGYLFSFRKCCLFCPQPQLGKELEARTDDGCMSGTAQWPRSKTRWPGPGHCQQEKE